MMQFSGVEYLMIDIANNFGKDKESFPDRIQWVKDNEHQLETLTQQADEPALYIAGVKALRQSQRGEAIGYAISLDATASGTQMLACMTGDRQAATHVNLVPNGKRNDFYTAVYDVFKSTSDEARDISRKDLKASVMTAFYTSEAVPKAVFGQGELLREFYKTLEQEAPGCWALNTFMKNLWDPEAIRYDWVMPDNFHAHFLVEGRVTETVDFMGSAVDVSYRVQMPIEKGRALGANTTHSVDGFIAREMCRRCMYDPRSINRVKGLVNSNDHFDIGSGDHVVMVKTLWNLYQESGYLSARILDHLFTHTIGLVDRKVIKELIDSLPKKPFDLFVVHDCYRCLPNYGNDVRWQYILCMSQLAKSEMLSFLLSQIAREPVNVEKMDKSIWKDILDSDYAIC